MISFDRALRIFKVSHITEKTFQYQRYFFSYDTEFCNYDLVVIGGGIIGTAASCEIQKRHPSMKIALLEKESQLAKHQSGHNGGVIYSGIFYTPGSQMAKHCVEGMQEMYKYCSEKNIPYKKCGKLIVATNYKEVNSLMQWHNRARENNVKGVEIIDGPRIKEIEPYCKGVKALWSSQTGCVDYVAVTKSLADDFRAIGGDVFLNFQVCAFSESEINVDYPVTVRGSKVCQIIQARYIITCAGLHSDILAECSGFSRLPQIIPFRGEFCLLKEGKCHMIKGHIYTLPDPRKIPSLGPHFSPRMDGSVLIGPNATLALKREGYQWNDIDLKDFFDTISHPGFSNMMIKNFRVGIIDLFRSIFTTQNMKVLRRFVPDISENDVFRGPTGVSAQPVDNNGKFIHELMLEDKDEPALAKQILHCRNVPSPGATSALSIAKVIADKFENKFKI